MCSYLFVCFELNKNGLLQQKINVDCVKVKLVEKYNAEYRNSSVTVEMKTKYFF